MVSLPSQSRVFQARGVPIRTRAGGDLPSGSKFAPCWRRVFEIVERLDVTCSLCHSRFATRNLLFKHLRDAHAWSPPCRESDEERVALVFGYVGSAYHGLQRNDAEDALATVEGELWRAIGTVHPSFDAARRAKVNPPALSRAARTDRGVHAVANVLGLSLPALGGSSARWLEEVNAALPPEVRVLRRLRTTAEFHAQRHCERRRYEYLAPLRRRVP